MGRLAAIPMDPRPPQCADPCLPLLRRGSWLVQQSTVGSGAWLQPRVGSSLRVTLLDRGGIYHVRNESLQFLLGIVLSSGSSNRVREEIVVSHKSISKKRRCKDERG